MKINSIKYKNKTSAISYDMVEENINILSSARKILDLDINEDINYIAKYNITDYNGKCRLNSYGTPGLISKTQKITDVQLDYFTISSNMIDKNDNDSVEYAGLQLGEIENNYFARLLSFCSDSYGVFTPPNGDSSYLLKIFQEIQKQFLLMSEHKLYPKFIVCDTFSLLKILMYHPSFKTVSSENKPHMADILFQKEPIHIIINNMMGNDFYSNICLCADLVGAMHIKGGLKYWEDKDQIIFTETIGMGIFEEKGVKRFLIKK